MSATLLALLFRAFLVPRGGVVVVVAAVVPINSSVV